MLTVLYCFKWQIRWHLNSKKFTQRKLTFCKLAKQSTCSNIPSSNQTFCNLIYIPTFCSPTNKPFNFSLANFYCFQFDGLGKQSPSQNSDLDFDVDSDSDSYLIPTCFLLFASIFWYNFNWLFDFWDFGLVACLLSSPFKKRYRIAI